MRAVLALWRMRIRRDAVQLTLWIVGIVLLALAGVAGVGQSYGTVADRTGLLATVMANPVIMLFRGLPSGSGRGAFALFLILPFLILLAGLMSSFLAVRHTRAEEESGRAELVGGTMAARRAPFVATVLHAVAANAVLAVLVAAVLAASGVGGRGSVVSGLATGFGGLVFFAFSLLGAQLFATARSANGFGVIVVLASYLVAGVGNAAGTPNAALTSIESSGLTWASPIGWLEQTRPFDQDALAPLALTLGLAAALVVVAALAANARDLGGSFIPERRGPAHAGPALAGPTALVARLTWPAIVAWTVGGLLSGLLATSLASAVSSASSKIPSVQVILKALSKDGNLEEGTIVIFFTMVGILAACCAVQVVCRGRQEEAHGTVEPVWSGAVGRMRWLAGYVLLAAVGIVAVVAAAALGAWLGLASRNGDLSLMRAVWITAWGQALAATVFLAVAALILVVLPRFTIGVAWTLVLLALLLGLFGPLFGMPDGVVSLSVVGVAPTVTSTGTDLRGGVWLALATVVALAAAFAAVRRRPLVQAG